MRKWIAALLCLLLACSFCPSLAAEDADALYDRGKAATDAGDYQSAFELFSQAAALGNAQGQNGLGVCYLLGNGVEQSYEKALEYITLAAEQGLAKAQFNLGAMYENGEGVEQSYEKAAEYRDKIRELERKIAAEEKGGGADGRA